MEEFADVVIVGAGHAGSQTAITLRQRGFDGSIMLVGDEPELPYERPPLSKDYMAGEKPFERILLRPAGFWPERDISLNLGRRVERVDAGGRSLILRGGGRVGYGTLVWAAGGRARRLSCQGHDLSGVHSIRTRADVDRLVGELPDVETIVVVGGGYIGLEAAAVLAKMGRRVIVLEALDRVLARVAGEPLSRFYEAEHRGHGVDVRLGVVVELIEGESGAVTGVRLADVGMVECQMVVVGIGILPNVEPLLEAGAVGGNGVMVDQACRTSLPDVYAVGDCAAHASAFAAGAIIRLESVQNANDQAIVVARGIIGEDATYAATPWFWSNQYDLRLQTVGLSMGFDVCVERGFPASRSFSLVYLREGRVVALDCVNATRDYVQGKALVESGAIISPEVLADVSIPLKLLAASSL